MITLKKNDKIIIIAAVAVIIIAGVGIAAYTPEDVKETYAPMMGNSYTITWNTASSNSETISGSASKDAVKKVTYMLDQKNIKSITFNMSWTDDKATLLNRFGLDTLELKITAPDGTEERAQATSAKKTKQGKVSITMMVNSRPPTIDVIQANSSTEAEIKAENNPSSEKFTKEEFDLAISVLIGEKRILKKFMDKGNGFKIDITYEYYYPTVFEETIEETGDNMFNDIRGQNYKPPFLSMIIGTGCGRYI
ncbi:MAG: hypothetical protein KKC68_06825 [Candidatus Thermoplasmatota archaeon]|nr:hypothetical protein [Candidatus Thermoplasmatota archaeon]MBU1941474.1 hypothetical protein [Candidatus Thermoplasmatota archaeon]